MKLESLIVTAQQEQGLAAFRAQQDDGMQDFLKFYSMWQFEQGYFDDSNEFLKDMEKIENETI